MSHALARPLSEDEFDDLAGFLADQSPLDTDGLFGVLHAVAVAPSVLAPSRWMPLVLSGDIDDPRGIELVLRMYNEVLDALRDGTGYFPEEDDEVGCVSFAAGYAAAAALDPEWIGDADRWTFASCMAYLGDRLDLVPPHTLAKLDAVPDSKDTLRKQLGSLVVTTHSSFTEYRRTLLHAPRAPVRTMRIGRNEPCPCGSGKKFKRCCIDRPPVNSN